MKNLYFPLFDHHLTVSDHTAAELREAGRGHVVPRGVWVRPMGVDAETFSPRAKRTDVRRSLSTACGGGENSVLILYAGRLAREKNLGLLVQTLSILKNDPVHDYRLVVAGDGGERDRLEADLRLECGNRFALLGHLGSRERLAEVYANCDLFLHPNPSEPFGIAPLEAMAAGLAFAGPRAGGVKVYANDENAWLTTPDARSYATIIRRAIENPQERQRRIECALSTVQRYDWRTVARQFLELYEDLAAWANGSRERPQAAPDFLSTRGNRLGMEV
jgi:alpha-1,6-mannosyltransferase